MSFAGMRVLAFESRRSTEIAELIRRQQGDPIVAPSLREAPLESNTQTLQFADRLAAGEFDMMIFLTGVGTRALANLLADRIAFTEALRKLTVVARGPKPMAALRELDVPVNVAVPEPNTWREIVGAIKARPERRVALQEYGRPSVELIDGLRSQGREVTPVRIYQYELPLDTGPLNAAVQQLADGRIDVAMFTTSVQIIHLAELARAAKSEVAMLAGLRRAVIASIGPTTSETLEEFGLTPDIVPTRPKMGFLVKEAAELAPSILASKRGS